MNQGSRIRELFSRGEILLSVGAYDALSARIIDRAGLPSVYVTGYGAAASMLALPDIGLMTMSEMVRHIRCIASAVNCAVIADADTGYGGPANIARTVREYEAAGVDVIQLEDQQWPKRCGHMEGKRLVAAQEMETRIRTAVAARKSEDFLIIARTDAIALEGFEAALERARAYQRAGADILFVEAPRTDSELAEIPKRLNAPCLANMVEGGKTPYRSPARLQEMGYRVAIFPISTLLGAARAVTRIVRAFAETGNVDAVADEMLTFEAFNDLIGVDEYTNPNE